MELFSEGQNLKLQSDNIVVAVRVRPLSQDEILQGEANTIRVVEDGRSMSVIEPGLGGHNMIRNFQVRTCPIEFLLGSESWLMSWKGETPCSRCQLSCIRAVPLFHGPLN